MLRPISKKQDADGIETVPVGASEPSDLSSSQTRAALLQRWITLAEMQQRVIGVLAAEVSRTSSYIEAEVDSLSARFQKLALSVQRQTGDIDRLTNLVSGVEVERKTVPIDEIADVLVDMLDRLVEKQPQLSKDSTTRVRVPEEIGMAGGRSDSLPARSRFEELMAALARREDSLEKLAAKVATENCVSSTDVDALITGMQFQDRARQRLDHISDTLNVIRLTFESVRHETLIDANGLVAPASLDMESIRNLLAGFTMSEFRERFVAHVIEGKAVDWAGAASSERASENGTTELF